ncbi:MAG TPA: hypothetical protein VLV55_07305 [Rhizomicrobium sp.]|nr:hypothetical protein [Rhizomicrobium sp.]
MSISKLVIALAAVSLVSTAAFAGPSGSPLKGAIKQPPVQTLKLAKEAYVTGNGLSTSLPQFAYTPIDTGTVLRCTKPTCVISADVTAQMQTGGADWAICITVDGGDIECQYQGVQSGPSSFVVGNVGASSPEAIGKHTVQTSLYTESTTATYQYFAMHYAVHE